MIKEKNEKNIFDINFLKNELKGNLKNIEKINKNKNLIY